jgi:probable addiction module antidote protein
MLEDGDARAVPIALRTVAEALGGMAALAERTGLSRETLYRTLSKDGNPRLDTLAALLDAFGLRLTVRPQAEGAPWGEARPVRRSLPERWRRREQANVSTLARRFPFLINSFGCWRRTRPSKWRMRYSSAVVNHC